MDGREALIMKVASDIKLFTTQGGNSIQHYTSTWDRLRQYRWSEEYIVLGKMFNKFDWLV